MRVLVTGVAGYLGRVIAAALQNAEFDVVGTARARLATHVPFEFHALDIAGDTAVAEFQARVHPCSAIVHAAASLDMRADQPHVSMCNAVGTHRMLALARAWNCERFVFLSSAALIGRPQATPATETHPVAPPTVYHASKYYGEQITALCCTGPLRGVSLRITAPVGPNMPRNRMLRTFVERARQHAPITIHGEGTRQQDYVDERDVAQAVQRALRTQAAGVYNIGSGRSHANLEVAERCVEVLDSSSSIQFTGASDPDEGVTFAYAIDRARLELGYVPEYSLSDTIAAIAAGETAS